MSDLQNKTTIYVCIRDRYSFAHLCEKPIAAFLSRKEAEYYVWTKNQEIREAQRFNPYSRERLTIEEIALEKVVFDDKLYKKFVKEKTEAINSEIQKEKSCSESNQRKIFELEGELKNYEIIG